MHSILVLITSSILHISSGIAYFSAADPNLSPGALFESLSSSSLGWSCLEYILYSTRSLNDNLPLSTCFLVAESFDLGSPIDSRNATALVLLALLWFVF